MFRLVYFLATLTTSRRLAATILSLARRPCWSLRELDRQPRRLGQLVATGLFTRITLQLRLERFQIHQLLHLPSQSDFLLVGQQWHAANVSQIRATRSTSKWETLQPSQRFWAWKQRSQPEPWGASLSYVKSTLRNVNRLSENAKTRKWVEIPAACTSCGRWISSHPAVFK